MTEGESPPSPEPVPIERARRRRAARRGGQRWDIDAIAYHLRASTLVWPDPDLGEGHRLLIGPENQPVTALELYPAKAIARVRAADLLIQLSGLAPPLITKEELPPDHESILLLKQDASGALRVGLNAQGDVSLSIAPTQALKAEVTPPAASAKDKPQEHPNSVSRAQEKASGQPPAENAAEKEQQSRVAVKGRVGAAPTFRTTAKGLSVVRFPVAEHQGETTIWHQVVVFGERADNLHETLEKGSEVQVVGYLHERPSRADINKTVREIYAAVVKAQS